ncbi:sensor histidine kinase [Paenibacillus cymbidii]|uniref:sensor histidine kinase n=1 Tax=Paenibacillus cymbidii TaxID=1639034 RepID=UPI00108046B2|nr:sensor histidine kinase [Paenibacillus cymbidii]
MKPWQRFAVHYTIFPKLVVAFLLVLAPLYLLALVMNKQDETSVGEELSNSLESRVIFYANTLENEKDHILALQREYVNDKDLRQISFVGGILAPYSWSDTVLNIQNKLQLIRSSSVYIENVSAHILTIGRTISSNLPLSDSIAEDYAAVKGKRPDNAEFIYWQDRLYLSLAFPDPPLPGRDPAYVLAIELSVDKLKQTLAQMTNYRNASAILMNPSQGWTIAGDTDAAAFEPISRLLQREYDERRTEGVVSETIGNDSYLVAFRYLPSFGSFLSVYVPKQQVFGKLDTNRQLFWLLSAISLLVVVVYSYWIFRLIHRPLNVLVRSFRRVEDGQMEPVQAPRGHDEFYYLFNHFNAMVDKLKVLIHQVYEQKIRAQSSELKQLQSQINPHFLYNTYFILYRLAKVQDHDGVMRFSQHLGQYFQFITRSAADEVPLGEEIRHSRTYVEIQHIRFSNRIQVDFAELPEVWQLTPVPRLIVQPVLENAYKYGLEGKLEDGRITIRFREQEGHLIITVEDNGEELDEERLQELNLQLIEFCADRETTGLLNVHRRLQLMFGETCGVSLSRGEWGGMKVELAIAAAQVENGGI